MTRFLQEAWPFVVIAIVALGVFRLVFNRLTPYDDSKVKQGGSKAAKAAAITRWGAYIGYVTATMGSLVMSDQPYWYDVMMFGLDSVVALVVFSAAYYAIDLTMLRRINNAAEIEKGNIAVAKVEFCGYVGLGIIMNASFAGGGDQSLVSGMLNAALFSVVALVTLMVAYTVYTIGWAIRGCNLDDQILRGSRAAAIEAGSLLLALSVALWFSIVGDFEGWSEDLASYGKAAALSIAAVSVSRAAASLLMFKLGRTRKGAHHGNMTKAVVVGLVSIIAGAIAGLLFYTYL